MLGLKLNRQNPKEGAFMYSSIQQFCNDGTKKLIKVLDTYNKDVSKIAEMVY